MSAPNALIGDKSVECLGNPEEKNTFPFLQLWHPFHHRNCQDPKSTSTRKLVACSAEQIQAALKHADVVSDANSPWSSLPLKERYEILKEAVAAIDAEKEVYAKTDVLETGIPLPVQYQIAEGLCPVALGSMEKAMTDVLDCKQKVPSRFGGNIIGKRRPISPALILAPWNVPVGTIIPKLFCALLCGCKVIVKPSEYAPTSITRMCHTIHSIIFGKYKIPNVLQVVHGGGFVGSQLVSAKEIQCVQFTGAPKTAALVATQCAPLLKPLLAECGGSNSLIICKDACLTAAVRYVAFSTLTLNGQWCMSASRVFVHKSLKHDFLRLLRRYLEKRVRLMCTNEDLEGVMMQEMTPCAIGMEDEYGSSFSADRTISTEEQSDVDKKKKNNNSNVALLELGPLASETHADSIRNLIEELSNSQQQQDSSGVPNTTNPTLNPVISSKDKTFILFDIERVWRQRQLSNSSPLSCDCKQETLPRSYISPQCIIEPDPALSAKRELFGPVFSLHEFDEEDEAIRKTNLSTGMLACYIFSKDVERAQKIGVQLRTGMSMVNSTNFGFEPEDPSMEIESEFWGSAGSGSDGTGAAAARFFSRITWSGVAGDQNHDGHELH